MKDALLVTRNIALFCLIALTVLTYFALKANPFAYESLVEIITIQVVLIGIVTTTYPLVFLLNKYSIKVNKRF